MGRMAVCVVLAVVSIASSPAARQIALDSGRWKNYTDMKTVSALAISYDSLWAATSGGLFLFLSSSGRFVKHTNSEGLSSNELTAVTIDRIGRVWVGSSDGFMNVYDPHTQVWREIRDIRQSQRIQKGIRALYVLGDSLLVGTDFGVTVFVMSRFEFLDTYSNFGFPSQAKVNDVIVHNKRLFVATDQGIAAGSLSSPNLASPSSWTRYADSDGLPSRLTTALAVLRDTVVAGTENGASWFDGNSFRPIPSLAGKSIADLAARTPDLAILWNDATSFTSATITSVNGTPAGVVSNSGGKASSLAMQQAQPTIWIGTTFKGISTYSNNAWKYFAPNGPQSNLFTSLAVDVNGVVWSASGISQRGRGFYRYDAAKPEPQQWKNFTVGDYPIMAFDDYYKVSLGRDSVVWVSSWGRGVLEIAGDSIRRKLDENSTPPLAGTVLHDPSYVVVGGVATDSKGDTWIVNRTANNGNHLARLSGNNTVAYVNSPSEGIFTNLVIDRNNTKWLANSEPSNKPITGLYYFNEDTLVTGTRLLGGWGMMSSADGFPANTNNAVLSLAVDREGDVCVGTDNTMFIITDPRNPKANRVTSFPLRGQVVQAIAVDAINNKWVGTKEGVIVVNPDGTQLIAQYSVLSTNGKLVDDDVRSIAIDQQRGIAYFGTEKGLSSLEILPVRTARSFSTLEFGPNPFLIPADRALTIRPLVEDCAVKILSVKGALIAEFKAQGGGRAFWDGKDSSGEFVASGVYFVVAFAENGNQIGTGKIAVVRR